MSNPSNVSIDEYPEWIKVGEAAKMLGISPNSVKKLVRDGHLTAYRVRGITGIQFKKKDVLGLIEEVRKDDSRDPRVENNS